jgi:hypothetical protein
MASPIASDIGTILVAMREKLVADGIFTYPCCFVTILPDSALTLPPGDHIAVIRPARQYVRQSVVDGAGNNFLWMDGEFTVALWNRLDLDPTGEGHADDYITDTALGFTKLITCITNSLSQLALQDSNSNYVIIEPARLNGFDFVPTIGPEGRGVCNTTWQLSWQSRIGC